MLLSFAGQIVDRSKAEDQTRPVSAADQTGIEVYDENGDPVEPAPEPLVPGEAASCSALMGCKSMSPEWTNREWLPGPDSNQRPSG